MNLARFSSVIAMFLLLTVHSSQTAIAQVSSTASDRFGTNAADFSVNTQSRQTDVNPSTQSGADTNSAQSSRKPPQAMEGDVNVHGTVSAGGVTPPQGFKSGIVVMPASYNPNVGIDVIAAGAKGDCTSDDHDAISRAMAVASANRNAQPLPLRFPRPPGGCYKTSTLVWQGYSMVGEVSTQGDNNGGSIPVQLRSMPGQDLFNVPDVDDVATQVVSRAPYIAHMAWTVDDSVDASGQHPHRKPGRTVNDGVTNGTATVTSSKMQCHPGDVGQGILLTYTDGAVQSSTIKSCNSFQGNSGTSITIASPAKESQAGVQLYISLAGIPANDTVGNCALAIDNRDADTANWKKKGPAALLVYAVFRDMSIQGLSGRNQNHSCGIFTQGGMGSTYGSTFEDMLITGLVYDFAVVPADVNPLSNSSGSNNDFNFWNRMKIAGTYPFIFYNGSYGHISSMQLASATGVQIVSAWTGIETSSGMWEISIPEVEMNTSGGTSMRLEGTLHLVTNTAIGDGGAFTYWDANASNCIGCMLRAPGRGNSTLQMGGALNNIELSDAIDRVSVVDDPALGNRIVGLHAFNPFKGKEYSRPVMLNGARGEYANERTADFLNGSATAPYLNKNDLWVWPHDEAWAGGQPQVVADPASETGYYTRLDANYSTVGTTAWPSHLWVIGTNLPAKINTLWSRVKCPHASPTQTFTMTVWIKQPGGTNDATITSPPLTCSTTYQSVGFPVPMASHPGDHVEIGYTRTDEVDIAWRGWEPTRDDEVASPHENATTSSGSNVTTIKDTPYTGKSSIANVLLYATANDRRIHQYQFCWYHIVLVASGGGTSYGTVTYTSHGHLFSSVRLSGNVSLASQYNDSSAVGDTCRTFAADPNTRVYYSLAMESTAGVATVSYSGKLIDLGPVQ
jgi:hypothetical protein